LNPLLANGQVYGAFAQAVGASLYEEFAYDSAGNFLNGTFADYRIPTATEVPVPHIIHRTTPSPVTPLGAKGIAEGNSMSTPACIANAIADAIGVEDIRLPALPSRVHELLVSAGHIAPLEAARQGDQSEASLTSLLTETHSPLNTSGEVSVSAAPEEIFSILMDAQRLKHVIPGCESIEKTSTSSDRVIYKCRSVIRIGVVKAGFDVMMEISDIRAPTGFSLKGSGSSPLGNLSGSGVVSLARIEEETRLSYRYHVAVSGKLAAVGSRLLEGSSRLVLGQFFKALSREAGGAQASRVRPWWQQFLHWLGGRP
jgi:2-furoyl-CoA dehydrogenase large subunit